MQNEQKPNIQGNIDSTATANQEEASNEQAEYLTTQDTVQQQIPDNVNIISAAAQNNAEQQETAASTADLSVATTNTQTTTETENLTTAPQTAELSRDTTESNQQPANTNAQLAAPAQPEQSNSNISKTKKTKNSKGTTLMAGLALGALLGGVLGAAVYAAVAGPQNSASATGSAGVIELANTESATTVSAIAAARTQSVVTLEVRGEQTAGSGSGVIYSEDGYIITNAHVIAIEDGNTNPSVTVRMSDGSLLAAKVVGLDPYADLAVVKVEANGLTPMPIADSSKLNVGDLTVAIGAPLELPSTVTSGVVSALNRGIAVASSLIDSDNGSGQGENSQEDPSLPWQFELPGEDTQQQQQQQQQTTSSSTVTLPVIQTDASINPGNSGGALLNGDGELVGINVAIASTASSSNQTAGSVGLGFAIPANLVQRVVDDLIAGEQPSHGLLGASVADASASAGATHAGGLIAEVVAGSAAEKGGLQKGDIITEVDGVAAADGTSVSALVRMHEGASTVTITYIRDGKEKQTEVTLGSL